MEDLGMVPDLFGKTKTVLNHAHVPPGSRSSWCLEREAGPRTRRFFQNADKETTAIILVGPDADGMLEIRVKQEVRKFSQARGIIQPRHVYRHDPQTWILFQYGIDNLLILLRTEGAGAINDAAAGFAGVDRALQNADLNTI